MLWAEANRLDLTRVPPDNALVQSVTRKIVDQSMNAGLRHSEERNRILTSVSNWRYPPPWSHPPTEAPDGGKAQFMTSMQG